MRAFGVAAALLALGLRPAAAQTYYLVVSGVGGEPQYGALLTQWGRTVVDGARSLGVPDSNVTFLAEHPESDPGHISGPAVKERMVAALEAIGRRAGPGADVIIVLFGHGSDRGDGARFNLVGPDITAQEVAAMVSALHVRHVVVVNTSSASGGFVAALSAPGRVIITATKSRYERNWARFGEFFAQAAHGAGGDDADTDKDGQVSVLEAFRFAKREVARAYEKENRLLTEHAVLDDNGDGVGSAEPSDTSGDGVLAAAVFLGPAGGAVAAGTADPELKRLYARRDSLDQRIAELRASKSRLAPETYQQQLEGLLVELATATRAIREREGVKRP